MFCVQYHPEAAPGPHDADYLFRQFLDEMERRVEALVNVGFELRAGFEER